MACTVARKAALPASMNFVKAWGTGAPPPLCGTKTEPAPLKRVPLPSDASTAAQDELDGAPLRAAPAKSFKMHVGAYISIPTKNARDLPRPQYAAQPQAAQQEGVDPFEGLPFRGMAERLGTAVMPALEQARAAERQSKLAARRAAAEAEVIVPHVPHVLPFTRWAASSTKFQSTFIADPPAQRKKARLSWYHPDDTMVPRDWFTGGLLADLKYYSPFGLWRSEPAAQPAA